jgi:SAM-dependent methyltransferase
MAFESNYAEIYDLLYENKDYVGEAAYIDNLISLCSRKGKESVILDLACGTGKHTFLLEKLGYNVDGSDISADMIKLAKESSEEKASKANFFNYSFQESNNISGRYDVVISMFSAFDYLNTLTDIEKSLRNIHNLLEDGGMFIFDYWNGNAVVRDYSPVKILRRKNKNGELLRVSETTINPLSQIATVKFTCLYFKDDLKAIEFSEVHDMRYFYFSELENLLMSNGFKIKFRAPFLSKDNSGVFDNYEWNISIVAEKV